MIYTYALTAFLNDIVDVEQATQEVVDDPGITTALTCITEDGEAADVDFDFVSTLSAGEITALAALVAAHDGAGLTHFRCHQALVAVDTDTAITQTSAWQAAGMATLEPDLDIKDLTKIRVRVSGRIKTADALGELRVSELNRTAGSSVVLDSPVYSCANTSSVWAFFDFDTNVTLRSGLSEFTVEGRKNAGANFNIKFVTLSFLELL